MVTNTTTPARASSTVSPSNTPLSNAPSGKPSTGPAGNSNPLKESFHLLDLLEQVKNVSAALEEFKEDHKYVNDMGNKHLEVMIESLGWIYSTGRTQVGQISTVKYLNPPRGDQPRGDRWGRHRGQR